MKKVLKISLIILLIIFLIGVFLGALLLNKIHKVNAETLLDINKLNTSGQFITFVDNNNNENNFLISNTKTDLSKLNDYTKNAFISIEDKKFYTHKGINLGRTIKAGLKNILNGKIIEGGSTITQQLIKNTHLTKEKTIERKIKELALSKKLEKLYSKDEILETYLNVIYFGDNCYGIEDASMHYFSKDASSLSIAESATLAGLIKAPNTYSPTKNKEKCLKRRNLVLSEMLKDNYISNDEYNNSKKEDLNLNLTEKIENQMNTYDKIALNEAINILGLTEKQIAFNGIKIYTNKNASIQQKLETLLISQKENLVNQGLDYDISNIVINNKTGKIEAYYSTSIYDVDTLKRQPGSSIKPILVYAPAIENNLISPSTLILDEETDFNGYKPHNYNNTFNGYVSARTALEKSLNIPAVKVLTYIGINNAINFAENNGIHFDENDNNLAISLGGFTYGETLKNIANSYQAIANNGNYIQASCIDKIETKTGKLLYKNNIETKKTMRDDTSTLLIDMLKGVTKNGTGKKLSFLPYEIASKTGTVSLKNSNLNTDAYNFAFTTNHTLGCWYGNLSGENLSNKITGSSYPTETNKTILESLYNTTTPENFKYSSDVIKLNIDLNNLKENNIITLAPDFISERYKQTELFSRFNLPNEDISLYTNSFEIKSDFINDCNIKFDAHNYFDYDIYLNDSIVHSLKDNEGEYTFTFKDLNTQINKIYVIRKLNTLSDEVYTSKSNIIEYYCNNNASSTIKDEKFDNIINNESKKIKTNNNWFF